MAVVARMASYAPPTRSDSGYTGAESGRREVVVVVAEKGQGTELWNHRDDLGLTQHVSANICAGAVEGGHNYGYAVRGTGTASDSSAPTSGVRSRTNLTTAPTSDMTVQFLSPGPV